MKWARKGVEKDVEALKKVAKPGLISPKKSKMLAAYDEEWKDGLNRLFVCGLCGP